MNARRRLVAAALVPFALALLDYLKVPRVALVGWSDGGIIGLDIAIHHPERLSALFAQGANATVDGLVTRPANTAALAAAGRRDRAEYRRLSSTPDQYPDFRAAVDAMWATQPNYTRAELAAIGVRTAVVTGDHDEVVRLDHARELAATIPGAQLVIPWMDWFIYAVWPSRS